MYPPASTDRTRLDASPEPADRQLRWKGRFLKCPPVLSRHERRDCHVPKPLPRGEEHLAVAVRNEGPGVEGRWTVEFSGIEAKPPVGLVGEQINAVTDPPRRAIEHASEFL